MKGKVLRMVLWSALLSSEVCLHTELSRYFLPLYSLYYRKTTFFAYWQILLQIRLTSSQVIYCQLQSG